MMSKADAKKAIIAVKMVTFTINSLMNLDSISLCHFLSNRIIINSKKHLII